MRPLTTALILTIWLTAIVNQNCRFSAAMIEAEVMLGDTATNLYLMKKDQEMAYRKLAQISRRLEARHD